jgi:MFS family permease
MNPEIHKSLRHNALVNVLDGAFFGLAMGFASFVTVLPLYVRTLTNSAILIGLIPAIHSVGWHLPQLFTARQVARQKQYKPMVLFWTIQERLPFLVLALVAWSMPRRGIQSTLWITYILLIWQGLGSGLTATPWQSMIAKIIPGDRRGTFLGTQTAAADLLASLGAVGAGYILKQMDSPLDFTLCFLITSAAMVVSWLFLAQTHEPDTIPDELPAAMSDYWSYLGEILRRDHRFRWFLIARVTSQVAIMGSAFYSVFAVSQLGASELSVGYMTAVLLAIQIFSNPVMGWLGDRWSQRGVMEIGLLAAILSCLLAWKAPNPNWFYLVFALFGIANTAVWTIGIAMIMRFGSDTDRPAYIGLANTLVAPATFLAPFLGGWLADLTGYPAAFIASAAGGLAAFSIFHWLVRDPSALSIQLHEREVGSAGD